MPTSTALKATVTRRPPADPVDQAERLLQAAHHEATENAATTEQEVPTAAPEPAPAQAPETPPKRDAHALQSAFLIGNLGKLVTVFTINGIRLTGKLRQFDHFTLLIEGPNGISSLVFKHAATTIVPVSTANGEPRQPQQGDAYP